MAIDTNWNVGSKQNALAEWGKHYMRRQHIPNIVRSESSPASHLLKESEYVLYRPTIFQLVSTAIVSTIATAFAVPMLSRVFGWELNSDILLTIFQGIEALINRVFFDIVFAIFPNVAEPEQDFIRIASSWLVIPMALSPTVPRALTREEAERNFKSIQRYTKSVVISLFVAAPMMLFFVGQGTSQSIVATMMVIALISFVVLELASRDITRGEFSFFGFFGRLLFQVIVLIAVFQLDTYLIQ